MTFVTGLWSVFCIVSVSFLLYGWRYYDLILVLFKKKVASAFGFTSKLVFGSAFTQPHSCEGQKYFLRKGWHVRISIKHALPPWVSKRGSELFLLPKVVKVGAHGAAPNEINENKTFTLSDMLGNRYAISHKWRWISGIVWSWEDGEGTKTGRAQRKSDCEAHRACASSPLNTCSISRS